MMRYLAACAFLAVVNAQCAFIGRPIVNRYPVRSLGPFPSETPLYPLVSSCGPPPSLEPIRPLGPLILPATNGPLFVLPSPPPPPPTVISNRCRCTKTVVKPQLFQRVIQVQKNQRFLKKTYKPVVERIAYSARPRC